MLNLNYIIIGALPAGERQILMENLKGAECRVLPGEGQKPYRRSGGPPAEECILISGDEAELSEACACGMAALGYQAKEDAEGTEEPGDQTRGDAEGGEKPGCQAKGDAAREEPGYRRGKACADMYAEGFEEVDVRFLLRVWQRHHHLPWTILTTERCVVKEFSMDYLDALFELYAGEGMTDYIAPLYPYGQEREYQESYIRYMYGFYGYGMWIVCDRETGSLIGRAGIECREELGGEPELGYVIGVPYQRQGYAAEVCRAILSYAKEELSMPFVNCLIEEGNRVSEHVALRLGFVPEGELILDGKRMKKYRHRLL